MAIRYKGWRLNPRTTTDGSSFGAYLVVETDSGPATIATELALTDRFPTREAALAASISNGKHWIDTR